MPQDNINQFNDIVERIIRTGHASFPNPFYAEPGSLGLSDEEPQRNSVGDTLYSDEWLALDSAVRATAKWMKEEGYLWSIGSQYQLSRKALAKAPSFITGADIPFIVNLD